MTREQYSLIMPIGLILIIASAIIISLIIPDLTNIFFLIYGLCGGVVIIIVGRLVRKTVTEPVTDERLQKLAERALWISHRIGSSIFILAGFILIYGFGYRTELKFIGLGVILTISLNSLIFSIIYASLKRRSS